MGTTLAEADTIVVAILESIVRALKSGEKVEIRGFGSFRTRQHEARKGRNPKTGARVEVTAKKVPRFKPSMELRALINEVPASKHY